MTREERKWHKEAVLSKLPEWYLGHDSINGPDELRIICNSYNISVPKKITDLFVQSRNPNNLCAVGTAYAELSKVLQKIGLYVGQEYGFVE